MDWMLVLSIASLLIGVLGVVIGIYGLRKAKTAGQAARVARQALLNQRAAEDFQEMTRTAISLASSIRTSNWDRTAELATDLRSDIAEALGAWSRILKSIEKDKFQVASASMKSLIELLPGHQGDIQTERQQAILSQCDFVIEVVSEVAGRLKYEEEP